MEHIKPFLKWAGGKLKLVDNITTFFPPHSIRYIEPFVGAGSVALNVKSSASIINDANPDLINVWRIIQKYPEELIRQCIPLFSGKFYNEISYYKLRDEFNARTASKIRHAAIFVYLNKHGFNGLCRYNLNNEFNVPIGKFKTISFDPDNLREISKKIKRWMITNQNYSHSIQTAGEGDIVYCDPPYIPDEQVKVSFNRYSKDSFTIDNQIQLAKLAAASSKRGATVIISNNDTPYSRELYSKLGANLSFVSVQRNISCNGEFRHKASELVAVFSP